MLANSLSSTPSGRFARIDGGHLAFVPNPLPREVPLDVPLVFELDTASRAVATLAGVGETLSNPHLLITPFLRREAVLSSRIEGTQASISDVFLYEVSGETRTERARDAREVVNYVRALNRGLELLPNLPVSTRLVKEVHSTLLEGVRGQEKMPGELRSRQVWIGSEGTSIGEARFVPPPQDLLPELMLDWERFVNEQFPMPPLIRCALMHYQFEAIHPFLDGNGRIGRLLITLLLCAERVLPTPLLYLSAYFERNREDYYDHLHNISATGNWDPWLRFFLRGVAEQANDAILRSRRVRQLHDIYRDLLQQDGASANALRLVDHLFVNPYVTTPAAAEVLGITKPGARRIIDRLAHVGVLEALPGKWRRFHVARQLLEAIEMPAADANATSKEES